MRGNTNSLRLTYAEVFYLAIALVLALLLRVPAMDRGLGRDEIDTVFYAVEVGSIWETVSSSVSFNNHIGYSMIARLSQSLIGRSEWAFRLPALLFGLIGIFAFWMFSRSLLTPRLAMIGVFLLALSPVHSAWSVSGRGYSGMILFTLLSTIYYLKLMKYPSRRRAIMLVIVSVLGIYIHLYSAFVVIVQFLFALSLYVGRRFRAHSDGVVSPATLRQILVSHIAVGVLSVLMYVPALRNLFHDLSARGRSDFSLAFPWKVIELLSGSEGALLALVVMAFSIGGLLSLLRSNPLEARYFVLLLVGPLTIMWFARPFDLYPRFFVYWLPYYLVLVLAGLKTFWCSTLSCGLKPLQYSSPLLASVLVSAVLLSWLLNWRNWIPEEGFRDASRALMAGAANSSALCAIGGDADVFQYYFDRRLVVPESMTDFLKVSGSNSEVRCVYYQASWESPEHTEIARFLKEHGSWSMVGKVTLFEYRE